jgi:DNA-binding GntR family transcriptional regulator
MSPAHQRPGLTTTGRIYQDLANRIISGELSPGQKLEEIALASQFGVSRTPIREALRELAAKGLVESTPRKGVIVARIGIEQLTDMLEAECEIEALCARLASQKMSALEKQHLQMIYDQASTIVGTGNNLQHYMVLNEQFHSLVAAGSRNETLVATVRALRDRLAPFRQAQSEDTKHRLSRSLEEHGNVINAVMRGDAEAAYTAMRAHNARLSTGVLFRLREQARIDGQSDLAQSVAGQGKSVGSRDAAKTAARLAASGRKKTSRGRFKR